MICRTSTEFDALLGAAGASFSVDPALLKAHVNRESGFDPQAYRYEPNVADASYGLAQVRYKVAKGLGLPGGPDQLYDPGVNLYYAAKLIRQNLDYARGDLATAISAYNAGFGNPPTRTGRRSGDGRFINQDYVDDVLGCLPRYAQDFAAGSAPEASPAPRAPGTALLSPTLVTIALGVVGVIVALLVFVVRGRP